MRLGVAAAIFDDEMVPGDVEVSDDTISAVGLSPPGSQGIAVPGLIDLQVNGFAGVDFLDTDVEGLFAAANAMAGHGVTAYQPTLITSPVAAYWPALETIRKAATVNAGASIVGVHIEGPFLSPAFCGAHDPNFLLSPNMELTRRLVEAGMTYMTLAPELPGALDLIPAMVRWGVVVSCGHSDAGADAANRAFNLGARAVTHLFNAHRPLRARDPGLGGVALTRSDVVLQAIFDGQHLAPETARLVMAAGEGRLALVTDAIEAATLGDGLYRIGGREVEVDGGVARLANGTLAGSVLTLDQALRNFIELGAGLPRAVSAVTSIPARLLGRSDIGTLRPGSRADVAVLDEEGQVVRTIITGRERFSR